MLTRIRISLCCSETASCSSSFPVLLDTARSPSLFIQKLPANKPQEIWWVPNLQVIAKFRWEKSSWWLWHFPEGRWNYWKMLIPAPLLLRGRQNTHVMFHSSGSWGFFFFFFWWHEVRFILFASSLKDQHPQAAELTSDHQQPAQARGWEEAAALVPGAGSAQLGPARGQGAHGDRHRHCMPHHLSPAFFWSYFYSSGQALTYKTLPEVWDLLIRYQPCKVFRAFSWPPASRELPVSVILPLQTPGSSTHLPFGVTAFISLSTDCWFTPCCCS